MAAGAPTSTRPPGGTERNADGRARDTTDQCAEHRAHRGDDPELVDCGGERGILVGLAGDVLHHRRREGRSRPAHPPTDGRHPSFDGFSNRLTDSITEVFDFYTDTDARDGTSPRIHPMGR
ncbi:hypothetical protein JMUB6875_31170 [Nocardia sp. JMUB6875]